MADDEDKCQRCGGAHALTACMHVKAIEFECGVISRVEFLTPADYGPPPAPAGLDERPDSEQPALPDYPRLGAMKRPPHA